MPVRERVILSALPAFHGHGNAGLGLAVAALAVFRAEAAPQGRTDGLAVSQRLAHVIPVASRADDPLPVQKLDIQYVGKIVHKIFESFLDGDGLLLRGPAFARRRFQKGLQRGHAALIAQSGPQQGQNGGKLALLRVHRQQHFLIHPLPEEMIRQRGTDRHEAQQPQHRREKNTQEHLGE